MMIVSLFVFFNYICGLWKAKFSVKTDTERNDCDDSSKSEIRKLTFEGEAEFEQGGVHFFPPVYIQRYRAVCSVLESQRLRGSIRKVVDFGCAEISFFGYVKHLEGVEEYVAVDIDGDTLINNYTKVNPFTADYLSRRCSPLKVIVLKGSVVEPDIRLKDTNVTVAIELIEHMYPNELNELPYNIFGVVNPEVAIFTTPNSDFNVLFSRPGFRHPDHKFEWTRSQFEDWAENLTVQFPAYEVSFHGIGKGPEGTEHLGCCSQMAVFLKKTKNEFCSSDDWKEIHECLYEIEYPFQTPEEKLNDTLEYEVYHSVRKFSEDVEFLVGDQIEIPIEVFIKSINVKCSTDKIIEFLIKEKRDVLYINNKATLILPFYAGDDSISSTLSTDDESNYVDNGIVVERREEPDYWDSDYMCTSNGNMISSEAEVKKVHNADENSLPAPENSVEQTNKTETQSAQIQREGESRIEEALINIPNSEVVEKVADSSFDNIPGVKEVTMTFNSDSQNARKSDKYFSTGAIPKQRNNFSEKLIVTNPLSTSICPKRDVSSVNIFVDQAELSVSSVGSEPSMNGSACPECTHIEPSKDPTHSQCSHNKTAKINSELSDLSHNTLRDNSTRMSRNFDQSEKSNVFKECLNLNSNENHVPSELNVSARDLEKDKTLIQPVITEECSSKQPIVLNIEQPSSSSVQRCHSLENVNVNNCKNKNFRYSLNIDNDLIDCDTTVVDMDLEVYGKGSSVPSLSDTLGSHSKAPDSGYPNSAHDMDMDLTPEQVDEIITETESSLEDEESSADERVEQVQGNNAPVVFLDNVENGDVANNNRDGEGNNMEGGEVVEEEIIGFEGVVMEGGDVEAGQHESDDEGLYLSALDVSNETLVPEDSSSHDATAFNSILDMPSSSSMRPFELDFVVSPPPPPESLDFPSWLLDILINDIRPGSGDAGSARRSLDESSSSSSSSESVIAPERSEPIEVIVPGDSMGGGDPPPVN